jgi:hypothetical protein
MARAEIRSLRFSRFDKERVLAALLISLCAHLLVWGGYEAGKKLDWWHQWRLPAWLHRLKVAPPPQPPPLANVEPTIFVDVSHAGTEVPKNAKYYSDKNSRAANAEESDANQPKLNGKQAVVPKTEDSSKFLPLQPTPPPQPTPVMKTEKPAKPEDLGDLQLAKREETPQPQKPLPRPRTLKQAQAQQSHQLPGQEMHQEGGVPRHALWSSLDAKATPFGEYDRAIVDAVTQHWYNLLDSRQFALDRTGKVTLHFKLNYDGSVTEMTTAENTVGPILGYVCQDAIEQSAPFAKWPPDMLRMIGKNYREITFTFYYY